ncbi:hypothetical protein EV714DRAFT_283356 [Schizophyllum commune]
MGRTDLAPDHHLTMSQVEEEEAVMTEAEGAEGVIVAAVDVAGAEDEAHEEGKCKHEEGAEAETSPNEDRHPIHRLPNEVLELVFLFSMPDELSNPTPGSHVAYFAHLARCRSIDYPRLLSRVCRRWRIAAQGCPALWSYICVDIGERKPFNASYYASILAKSSDFPLTLSFAVGKNQFLNTILHGPVFAPHIRRIRMLCIQLSSYFLPADAPRVDILPLFPTVDTPLLESLRLGCRKAPWSVIRYLDKLQRGGESIPDHLRFFRHAPRLEEFALEGFDDLDAAHEAMEFVSLRRLGLAGFDWANMTRLRLPDVPRRVFDLLRILGDAQRLVELRCTIFEDLEDEFSREGDDEYIIDTEDEIEDEDWDEEEEEEDVDEEEDDEADEEEEEEESDEDHPRANTRSAARTRVQQNSRTPINNATARALADARRAERERRQRELAARHAERETAREKQRRERAQLLGPHVFPDLTTLHLVLMAFEPETYGEYDDENPEERSGVERFLGALVMPALATLTIARRGEEFEDDYSDEDDDYGYGGGYGGGGGGNGEPKLHPHLHAQSPLHTLRLEDATKVMTAGFWQALARRELGRRKEQYGQMHRDGQMALLPNLHHLVVHQDRGRTGHGGFINVNVLDAVEARWKAGRGGGARIEVVHCPMLTKWRKGKPAQVVDAQMRGRLKRVQARADLELVLTELPFERKFARQVGDSNHGNSDEGCSDELDYDDGFEYY